MILYVHASLYFGVIFYLFFSLKRNLVLLRTHIQFTELLGVYDVYGYPIEDIDTSHNRSVSVTIHNIRISYVRYGTYDYNTSSV